MLVGGDGETETVRTSMGDSSSLLELVGGGEAAAKTAGTSMRHAPSLSVGGGDEGETTRTSSRCSSSSSVW